MKKCFRTVLCFIFAAFVLLCLVSCPTGVAEIFQPNLPTFGENGETSDPFFWGKWVCMNDGSEYEVFETTVEYDGNSYQITASDESSHTLTVRTLGTFEKQSESVIICDNIRYFRNGDRNLEYSLNIRSLLSETNGKRAYGVAKSRIYQSHVIESVSDEEGIITFTAPTSRDAQTVTITYGEETFEIPDLVVPYSGANMGTVAFVDKDDYSLKITGKISAGQKKDGYLFANNDEPYKMVLTITNISKNICETSFCSIEADDSRLSIYSTEEPDLNNITISSLAEGATKEINLFLQYGMLNEPYVDTKICIIIENPITGQIWEDSIPLRFFKGRIPITIGAKNSDNNDKSTLNGFVIYPDGNNQFFSVPNNKCQSIFVPTFKNTEFYKLVFSGAKAKSQTEKSTEMYYRIDFASLDLIMPVIISGSETRDFVRFGEQNHSEDAAYPKNGSLTEGFEAYLRADEIDYYKITIDSGEIEVDSDILFKPDDYCLKYTSEKGQVPKAIKFSGKILLSAAQLPVLNDVDDRFVAWYVGDTKVIPGYEVSSDITLTAKWEPYYLDEVYNDSQHISYKGSTETLLFDFSQYKESVDLKSELKYENGYSKEGVLTVHPVEAGKEIKTIYFKGAYNTTDAYGRMVEPIISGLCIRLSDDWESKSKPTIVLENIAFESSIANPLIDSPVDFLIEYKGKNKLSSLANDAISLICGPRIEINAYTNSSELTLITNTVNTSSEGSNAIKATDKVIINSDIDGDNFRGGTINIEGSNGLDYEDWIHDGRKGRDGSSGIVAPDTVIRNNAIVRIQAGNGGKGGTGRDGSSKKQAEDYKKGENGDDGYQGGAGGDGGNAISGNLEVIGSEIYLKGGNGGEGGKGGTGGNGGKGGNNKSWLGLDKNGDGGNGGKGGKGGTSGNGGDAISGFLTSDYYSTISTEKGLHGELGKGGSGGHPGDAGEVGWGGSGGQSGAWGRDGDLGEPGEDGIKYLGIKDSNNTTYN